MKKVYDLSHIIEESMPVYPGTEGPSLDLACSIEKDGFCERYLQMYSHTGTHMDAPSHLIAGGKTLSDFSVKQFCGTAFVFDATKSGKTIIDRADLEVYAETLKSVQFLLIYTAWDRFWGQDAYFHGFPVLSEEAAQYLCQFSFDGIGIDAISFDAVEAVDALMLANHKILLGHGLLFVENLKGLEPLKGQEIFFSAMPLKIAFGDGSPVRAFAMV